MALPELLEPFGTPAWLAGGHAIEIEPLHSVVEMSTGHALKRRQLTVGDRFVDVGKRMTAAQAAAWFAWYEGPLAAGSRDFTTPVANQGPGLRYWRARVEGEVQWEAGEAGDWRITARLRLIGAGSLTPPPSTTLADDVIVALHGSAVLVIASNLADDVTVALLPATALRDSVSVALIALNNYLADDVVVAMLVPVIDESGCPSYVTVTLQERATSYTPPDAASINLQELACSYTPPTPV
ncbi:MAG: hypothetical protein QM702_00230 [Rubrivivax sp.]